MKVGEKASEKALEKPSFLHGTEERHAGRIQERLVQQYINIHISEEFKNKEEYGRKVKVGFFLDREVIEKFRSLIQKKYGKYVRGLLSYEVEMALRYWIGLHTNAQSQNLRNRPNPTPKTAITFTQVKDYLLKNYYFELKPGQQIPRLHLERAIMAVRGSDPRTVKKWLETFHKMGLIKPVTSATWEVL